jgi:DNA-binding SARP family transcriptional activator/TolB-like protein/Tfp pilus assembly protein PilF
MPNAAFKILPANTFRLSFIGAAAMVLSIGILGPLTIETCDYRLGRLPRKARALVAFLAAQGGQAVSRERLADLLWPYQRSEQARHSLRNCLLELRKALGRSAAVHLDAGFANCRLQEAVVDLDEFERLARSQNRSDLEAAADLYRGEFLSDFYINSEPFQEWLAAARDRSLGVVCDVLQRLTAQQDAAGEHEAAVQSGRRLVTLDPLSELGQRALMRAYAHAGRRGEALRQYKSCAETLKHELGVAPDTETQALANEIARPGAVREPRVPSHVAEHPNPVTRAAAPELPPGGRIPPRLEAPSDAPEKPLWPCLLPSIAGAVAPVRNLTGDPGHQHLVEAFADDLVTDLLRHRRGLSLKQLGDERGIAGKVQPGHNPDRGYDYVVSGSVQRINPTTLRLNMRIAHVTTAEYVWVGRHEFRPEELAQVQTRITRRISRELHVLLLQTASRRAFARSCMQHGVTECLSRAESALQKGMRAELSAEAQQWFLMALANEPRNVEALTGLAVTCQHLVSNPWWGNPRSVAAAADLGQEAAALALSIAPRRAVAHCVQGMLYSAAGQLDEAAGALKQALTVDQGLGIAHGFAGYNAAFLGRADETLPAIERAMQSDRTDRRHGIWLFFGGFAELLLGDAEASIRLLQRSLGRNPSHGGAQLFLTAALSATGRRVEAAASAAKFRAQYPGYRTAVFEQLWISRSSCARYRAQIQPLFGEIRALGLAN